jgi:hypothetical protein
MWDWGSQSDEREEGCDVAPCGLVDIVRRFRETHQHDYVCSKRL